MKYLLLLAITSMTVSCSKSEHRQLVVTFNDGTADTVAVMLDHSFNSNYAKNHGFWTDGGGWGTDIVLSALQLDGTVKSWSLVNVRSFGLIPRGDK